VHLPAWKVFGTIVGDDDIASECAMQRGVRSAI